MVYKGAGYGTYTFDIIVQQQHLDSILLNVSEQFTRQRWAQIDASIINAVLIQWSC